MARTESKTPIWGVIAVLALLAVGANFLLRILSDPAMNCAPKLGRIK